MFRGIHVMNPVTPVGAGCFLQPLFLNWDNLDPITQKPIPDPEFRALNANFSTLAFDDNNPDMKLATGSAATIERGGTVLVLMFAGKMNADTSAENKDYRVRITRWYKVAHPLTDAKELKDFWMPVASTYSVTMGLTTNPTLGSDVGAIFASADIADTIVGVISPGTPDEIIYNPQNDLFAQLKLDCDGCDIISIELTLAGAAAAPDTAQVFYGFK